MKFLVTAFEPFGNDKENPTMEVLEKLKGITTVDTMVLPVTFDFFSDFIKKVHDKNYDYILHLGQAGGRNKVTFEKVAINYMDARIPDNQGNQPVGEPIIGQGADGIFTTLPVRELVLALQSKRYPVTMSYSAGTYVCNYIMYSSLYYFQNSETKVGFIHIPFSPSQVIDKEFPSMCTELVADSLKEAIILLGEGNFTTQDQRRISFGQTQ